MNIVILDACRDNPFGNRLPASAKGLAQIDAPPGTFIAYRDGARLHRRRRRRAQRPLHGHYLVQEIEETGRADRGSVQGGARGRAHANRRARRSRGKARRSRPTFEFRERRRGCVAAAPTAAAGAPAPASPPPAKRIATRGTAAHAFVGGRQLDLPGGEPARQERAARHAAGAATSRASEVLLGATATWATWWET